MLIVDPPVDWHTAEDAMLGMRDWNFSNPDALMFFPRLLAHDKLRGRFESFAPCGAVAGMLARCDQAAPLYGSAPNDEPVLRQGYRPSCLVTEDRRAKLAALGVNTLQPLRSAARSGLRLRTLAAGSAGAPDWKYLTARRLALFIVSSIERGTRWVVLAQPHVEVAALAEAQVRAFFEALHEEGAFIDRSPEDAFFVICDRRVNTPKDALARRFHLLIGFAAARIGEFHTYRITHTTAGSTVQAASLNTLTSAQYSPEERERIDRLASQLRI
jgi:phage tail sheath protein FI